MPAGVPVALRGIAFGGGSVIARVLVSAHAGTTWRNARLGADLGRYSFREWRLALPLVRGSRTIMVRAATAAGEIKPLEPRWQPAGYMRNVVETLKLEAV